MVLIREIQDFELSKYVEEQDELLPAVCLFGFRGSVVLHLGFMESVALVMFVGFLWA